MLIRLVAGALGLGACLAIPALTSAQTAPPPVETRPGTTTFRGDTGLWFVPAAEILPARRWSLSAYRVNFDYEQGFTDVSKFPITFGLGLADRLEFFGAFTAVARIDRDVRPLFLTDAGPATARAGGVVNRHPFVSEGWSGNQLGDLWIGGKFNLASEHTQAPAAFAIRPMVKIPTAGRDGGAGTGRLDFVLDAVASKELEPRIELSGFGGFIVRGDPDQFDLLNGFRWGFGAGFPTRRNLRLTTELHGEAYFGDTIEARESGPFPAVSVQRSPVNASLGLTWLGGNGLFAGAGLNWNLRHNARSDFGHRTTQTDTEHGTGRRFDDQTGDMLGFQVRIGYHPGVRVHLPPPPPPAPVIPEPVNRPPTVRASCEPCTVEVGRTSIVTADATDPDGDPLTYRWSAPAGSFATPADRQTPWTAPMQEGPVQVTVVVDDGRGGTDSDSVIIQVIRPAPVEVVFEDVHFDFDRYSLRPEATRALDEAIQAMQANPQLRIEVEGHTCNIGTAEYNLALGERRAHAVRDYLTSRGISADRLQTVSYGEERPKHDNAREETRRLNRRAALIVRLR